MLLPRYGVTFERNIVGHMRTSSFIIASIAGVATVTAAGVLAEPATLVIHPAFGATGTLAAHAWAASCQWATENYGRAPGLVVGLAAVLLLPPLALASGLITRLAMPRRTGPAARDSRTHAGTAPAAALSDAPDHPSNMAWPREAWLTLGHQPGLRRSMPRELLSIGRGDDNDLVLDEATVHRYHAVIQRTPDALFLIKDLSGPGGNGVFVNGERVTEAHLLDADRISLGAATLIFHARRIGDNSYRHDNLG
jgi:FHA domain